MILGQYPAGIYFQISSIFFLFSLVLIYWISQYLGHDKPFPQTWISTVAQHFPEYIFFRTSTISGSALIILGWLANHYYLLTVGYENVINMHKYKLSIMTGAGIIASCFLMGSTANIDTGKQNTHWHTFCASKFFILALFAQIYNTIVYTHLWYQHKVGNQTFVYLKLANLLLILIQLYASIKKGFFEVYGQAIDENDVENNKNIFLEWTLTLTLMFGFMIMSLDVRNFKFVYELDDKKYSVEQVQMNMEEVQ